MAKTDWDFVIDGTGSWAIVSAGGSMRLQLTFGKVYALWNGRNDLANSEVIAELRINTASSNNRGAFILRSDGSKNNMYILNVFYNTATRRKYYLYRVVNNVWTLLLTQVMDSVPPLSYIPIRFRIDGYQLTCHNYHGAAWHEIFVKEDELQSHAQGFAGIAGLSIVSSYSVNFDNIEIRERV